MKEISIIIPIFNEQENIPELHKRLTETIKTLSHNYEIIFINDGSKDKSFDKIEELSEKDSNVFYIDFSRNFGQQIAVTAGLDYCRGKCAIIIDADLQDPPELIEEMYKKYKKEFDVVYAKRAQRKGESWFKKITAKIFYRLMKKITSIDIPVDTGDYRLIDRKVIDALKKMPERNKFLRGQIAWLGFNQTHVLFNRQKRKHGETHYSLTKMINLAFDAITSFSNKPLRWINLIAVFTALFALIMIFFTFNNAAQIIIGIALLFSLGIIGIYVSRINKNVQDRPLYIVKKTNFQ